MYSRSTAMPQTVSEEAILGLDNVRLELPIAGAGSRVLAAFLDYLVVGIVSAALIIAAIVVETRTQRGWWIFALLLVGLFIVDYGYFAGMEIVTGGQTLGKRALDLVVLNRQGGRAGAPAFLIR